MRLLRAFATLWQPILASVDLAERPRAVVILTAVAAVGL